MILQVSFDIADLAKALEIAEKIKDYCDVLEVGNLLLQANGIKAIEEFQKHIPNKPLFVDSKIIEKGSETAELLINSGADWISIMAGTNPNIIRVAAEQAHSMKKKVMLDISDSFAQEQSALEDENLGADAIMIHENYNENNPVAFMEKWALITGNTKLPVFIEARITKKTSNAIFNLKPAGIIIGKAIVQAEDPVEQTMYFYNLCKS